MSAFEPPPCGGTDARKETDNSDYKRNFPLMNLGNLVPSETFWEVRKKVLDREWRAV